MGYDYDRVWGIFSVSAVFMWRQSRRQWLIPAGLTLKTFQATFCKLYVRCRFTKENLHSNVAVALAVMSTDSSPRPLGTHVSRSQTVCHTDTAGTQVVTALLHLIHCDTIDIFFFSPLMVL